VQLPAQDSELGAREVGFQLGGAQLELQGLLAALAVFEVIDDGERRGEKAAVRQEIHRQQVKDGEGIMLPVHGQVRGIGQPDVGQDAQEEAQVGDQEVNRRAAQQQAGETAADPAALQRKPPDEQQHRGGGEEPDAPRESVPAAQEDLHMFAVDQGAQFALAVITHAQDDADGEKQGNLHPELGAFFSGGEREAHGGRVSGPGGTAGGQRRYQTNFQSSKHFPAPCAGARRSAHGFRMSGAKPGLRQIPQKKGGPENRAASFETRNQPREVRTCTSGRRTRSGRGSRTCPCPCWNR
jgi:hypothetical protein